MNFCSALEKKILVLDGSMGALLQNRGLPAGMAPDVWMLENFEVIVGVHEEYARAGADILITNTFGASKWRLDEYGAYSKIREINARAIQAAREGGTRAGREVFVAGDVGPSGETVYPTGKKDFAEVAGLFYEQAKILVEEGVDLIIVETMFDSIEYRAALSGVRAASSKIPVIALATFNADGITDTGATPENIAAIAEGFHVQAVGVNCSTGPEPMVGIVQKMRSASPLVVAVQPNAGLPKIVEGATRFPMKAQDLAPFIPRFLEAGAGIIGGCCGTTPEYIRIVSELVQGKPPKSFESPGGVFVSGLSRSVRLGGDNPFVAIGERMNPSGRKKLSESLKKGDLSLLLKDAEEQMAAGGELLDLNVGVPLGDEPALMRQAVVAVQNQIPVPLMLDSANSHALDAGGCVYYGRPLLNSLNIEEEKLSEMLPIAKKHGAAVICMLTGVEVPKEAEVRFSNGLKLAEILIKEGFREEDFVFDCLGLVVSAMRDGSIQTLKTIEMIKARFPRSATTLGLSNTSFGLPNRPFVHNAFLAAAVQRGLDSAIMSVTDPAGRALAAAAQMWGPKPRMVEDFTDKFAIKIEWAGSAHSSAAPSISLAANEDLRTKEPAFVAKLPELESRLFRAIVDGKNQVVAAGCEEFLSHSRSEAMRLFIEVLTPAIRYLGDLFAARVKFIPHLIAAADAMKAGVAILEPALIEARAKNSDKKGVIIFATVKGDIHDIGKNICVLMLRNFGYEVIDLGRNVEMEEIIRVAKEKGAQVLALSALMTTTMMQMKIVIDAVKDRKLPFKVVIGGAVVTPDFAREISADGFSTDVGTVVSEMEKVLSVLKAI